MTRRFRGIDPRRPRALPSWPKILGVLGWALLLAESFRRARRRYPVESASAQ